MDDDQARELEALEGILSNQSKEPIKLSYGLLKFLTGNFTNEIGRGGFAVVYQGCWQNGVVAVKKISHAQDFSDTSFMGEIQCLKGGNHINIVRLLGYCSETQGELLEFNGKDVMAEVQHKLLCFEYVPQGNIRQYLQGEKPHGNDWPTRYKMIRGIIRGLQHLHEKNITHLDLKPENVMLDAHMEPKVTDFGVSRILDQGKSTMTTEHQIGTRRYMAPEIIDSGKFSFMSDMYALGIIIIELLTGISMIILENWDESLDVLDCPRARMCAEIARNCTNANRNKRPTINEVIRDLDAIEYMIPQSSKNQASGSAFTGTEYVDVYPLELQFPFVPNREMHCHLSLTNKTDRVVICMISPDGQDKYQGGFQGFLPPMSTTSITLRRDAEEELPSGTDNLEIEMLITGCDENLCRQKMSRLTMDGDASGEDRIKEILELPGLEAHSAVLTAVIISEGDEKSLVLDSTDEEGEVTYVDLLDVHPTEPWVLICGYGDDWVYIWNLHTKERMGVYERSEDPEYYDESGLPGEYLKAKFFPRKQWVLIGNSIGEILVRTCPTMEKVVRIKAHRDDVTSLAVHPTRPLILSCSYPSSLKLWEWNGDWSCTRTFDITTPVRDIMFDPKDAGTFATRGDDNFVKMWRIGHPDPVATTHQLDNYARTAIFTYSGDKHFIASVDRETTYIWDLQKEKHVHTIHIAETEEWIASVVCHPTSPVLVTASKDGSVRVWESKTFRLKKTYLNLPMDPTYLGFTGSRRLVIGYTKGVLAMDIDLE